MTATRINTDPRPLRLDRIPDDAAVEPNSLVCYVLPSRYASCRCGRFQFFTNEALDKGFIPHSVWTVDGREVPCGS